VRDTPAGTEETVMIRATLGLLLLALCLPHTAIADPQKLRILTWTDYVPADLAEDFRKETGITVEVMLTNNEDIISRLRASKGADFDLVHPSHDRVAGAQTQYGIYKPLDMSRIEQDRFLPEMLEATRKNTTVDGAVYGVPYLWGTEGLTVNTRRAQVSDYTDLCRADLKGKTAIRSVRPVLIAFAFAYGEDPFALYANPTAYAAMANRVVDRLIECMPNIGLVFSSEKEAQDGFRSGKVTAAMFWDAPSWALNRQAAPVRYIAPKSGMLGWIVASSIPARGGNDEAAYKWINFSARPENAARITRSVGNFSAARGTLKLVDPKLKAQLYHTFPKGFVNIHWYENVPAGIEDAEAPALARLREAAQAKR
jgi:spermidine/putrescine transport system substrate-binding protein